MSDVSQLNEQEKVFLAGAVKAMILAGGTVEEAELNDLDKIVRELNFPDFDQHLALFEKTVRNEEEFQFLAQNLFHAESKSLISQILWDLALQKGYPKPEEERIIRLIRLWWKE